MGLLGAVYLIGSFIVFLVTFSMILSKTSWLSDFYSFFDIIGYLAVSVIVSLVVGVVWPFVLVKIFLGKFV